MKKTQSILSDSRAFYESHNLSDWADALPESINLSNESAELVEKASQLGLDQAVVLPDFGTQMKSISTVIDEMAMRPVPGIPENPKFTKPYISDGWSKEPSGRVHQGTDGLESRKAGPYLLFYNLQNILDETLGKKGNQIARLFREQEWDGFTSPELLVAQRLWREREVVEGLPENETELGKFYWVWLVDSGDKVSCCAAFYGLQGVGMYGCKIGSANKQRGANVTVVVPLE